MVRRSWMALALIAGLAAAAPANATTILSETFDTENGGVAALNYTAFANFSVTSGSVDLLNGEFAGHGQYVDLGGGTITSNALPLVAGDYSMFFQLAGHKQSPVNYVADWAFFLNGAPFVGKAGAVSNVPGFFGGFIVDFTLAQNANFSFAFGSPTNDVGALLDNITITTVEPAQTAVPEPTTLLLFGTAAAYGLVRRRR